MILIGLIFLKIDMVLFRFTFYIPTQLMGKGTLTCKKKTLQDFASF